MSRPPLGTLLLLLVLLAAVLVAAASSEESEPSILIPVVDTPLGSFEGADGPVADDAMDDEDAAPVGSPIGTTMTEPKPELSNAPPGSIEADSSTSGGGAAAASTSTTQLLAAAAAVAVVTTAAGVFAF